MAKVKVSGLGFFLYDVLMRFIPIANHCADRRICRSCKQNALTLRKNIEKMHGMAIGIGGHTLMMEHPSVLRQTTECKIDSISQSWSILSEAGQPNEQPKP